MHGAFPHSLIDMPAGSPAGIAALLDRATAAAGIGVWACDLASETLTWSAGVYDIFGLPRGSAVSRQEAVLLYDEASRAEMERLRADAVRFGRGFTLDARIVRADGSPRWMRLTTDVVTDAGRAVALYGTKQDVTDERARWDALRLLADNDVVTGLAGRTAFQHRFFEASASDDLGALILIDLDDFKLVNDRFGHAAGDACLRTIGERLAACFSTATTVARIGGDEFAVVMPASANSEQVRHAVDRALERCAAPTTWRSRSFRVGASAGIAFAGPLHADPEALFAEADAALYAAKRAGRGRARLAGPAQPGRRIG